MVKYELIPGLRWEIFRVSWQAFTTRGASFENLQIYGYLEFSSNI